MLFEGQVEGQNGRILFDSGAAVNVISAAFVQKHALEVTPRGAVHPQLQLANGTCVNHMGQVTVSITIQGQHFPRIPCVVLDLVMDWTLILGNQWLRRTRSTLNFDELTIRGYTLNKSKPFVLRCGPLDKPITGSQCQDPKVLVISAVKAKRLVRSGCKSFLSTVTKVPDDASAMPQTSLVDDLLSTYADVFQDDIPGLPPDRPGISHTIPLCDPHGKPPSRPLYRLSRAEFEEAERQTKLLLAKGYIEPSTSPYGAPILFVQKKDGSLRMVIDYRALNKLTVKNKYPMPRIDDTLDQLQGSTVFTSLDLTSGYHQIRITEEDVPKTAFRTPMGLYQWRVLPFGLTNAPATFQTAMNAIFRPFLHKFVLVYLDDILIYSKTPEEHRVHLQQVLDVLREHQLYANRKKCSFAQPEVTYLGHVVSAAGVKVDPRKTAAVAEYPTPCNLSQLRSFLGLATYFRKFIRNFAHMAAPLHRLSRKDEPWHWSPACSSAFDAIKQALTTAPCLAFPDFSQPFEVHTDASLHGIGAVLYQNGRPLAFESRRLTPAEVNYATGEQELLAVVHALTVWRCYLEGSPEFRVVTDHKAITYMDSLPTLSRRQTRWAEFLSRFHFRWDHIAGKSNVVADALSRHPVSAGDYTPPCGFVNAIVASGVLAPSDTPCLPCPSLDAILRSSSPSTGGEPTSQSWKDKFVLGYTVDPWFHDPSNQKSLLPHEDLFLHDGKIAVPDAFGLRTHLLREMHDSPYAGHQGVRKTLKLIARHYWWPSMAQDVERYVTTCHLCQKNKARNLRPAGLLHPLSLPHVPWHTVTMDFITQLPTTELNHDAILVVVDKLTKMVHLTPTTTRATAEQTAQLYVDHVWKLHGVPQVIVSDRDPLFTSNFAKALCNILGTKQALSTAYHPQTDGQTERVNRVLEDMLRMYVSASQTDWDTKLSCAEFAINNADHESTGTTPFMLNYGHHPYLPVTLLSHVRAPSATDFVQRMQRLVNEARVAHRAATLKQAQYANSKRRDLQFSVGDWVLLSSKDLRFKQGSPKLLPRWVGPFQVHKRIGKQAYELNLPARWKIHDVFHVSKLEPYRRDGSIQPPPPTELLQGEEEYEVDSIMNHRRVNSRGKPKYEYLVRWTGHTPENDTWEPQQNLTNAPEVLKRYWDTVAQG